jgi:hypothetical protein
VRFGLIVLAIGAATALPGCGNTPVTPPDVAVPQQPNGTHPLSYPRLGVAVQIPDNWRAEAGKQPLVTTIASGAATVAIWRYPRTEPLPKSAKAFRAARKALIKAAMARDKTLKLVTAKITRFHGRPALELVGTETVGGEQRTVRSTHIFRDGSEVVVEALAPAAVFGGLVRSVFDPVLQSLKITPVQR